MARSDSSNVGWSASAATRAYTITTVVAAVSSSSAPAVRADVSGLPRVSDIRCSFHQ